VGQVAPSPKKGLNRALLLKLLMSLAFAVICWNSSIFALSQQLRNTNYADALAITPTEPVALAAKADALWAANPIAPDTLRLVSGIARQSLGQQALDPQALRVLTFANVGSWPQLKQRHAINLAIKVSRRDAGAYVWLIEDSVAHDDISGALANYDLALTTTTETSKFLFPLLTNALSDERIRAAFAPYIKENTTWLPGFVEYAIANSSDPSNVTDAISLAGGLPKRDIFHALEQGLLGKLVATKNIVAAKSFAEKISGPDRSLLFSINLTDAETALRNPQLVWQAAASASAGASFGQKSAMGEPTILVFAASGSRQIVAQKLLFLSEGSYQLDVQFGNIQAPPGAGVNWYMRCLGKGEVAQIWTSGPAMPPAGSKYHASLSVPKACTSQSLEIEVIGGQAQRDAEFEVTSLLLTPEVPGH
jgi:hypothetical protein